MSVALSAALALTSCSATPPVLRPKWTPTWQMNRSTCTFPDGNHSGFDNAERAAVEARYGLVTFGWESRVCINAQRSADPTDRCANARAEAGLDAQAARIKALNPQTRVFLYRNTELGLSPYEDQCTKMYDPRYAGYWLRNTTSGAPFNEAAHVGQFLPCLQNTTNLVQDQYFRDFRNASSALDFVDNVVGSVTRSANADGVWFDDASGCCAEHGDLTEAFSAAELAALRNATAATLLKAEQALIAAGKWSDHLFVTIPRATKAGDHCVSAIEAGAALGAADAPGHMLIGYDACPACTPPYANSTDDFKRHLATFLIGRGKYSWMGHSWIATRPPLWYAEWDFDYGLPLGPMARAGSVFTRRFSTVDVSVDCDTLDSKFAWKTDEQPPKNCGAVIEEKLAPCESRTWRWTIRSSYNGNGPTIHWLEFGDASGWMNGSAWTVTAKSHSNGPVSNLLKVDNESFWNADQPGAPKHGAPWMATIKTSSAITPTTFRYSIYFAGNAPRAFSVECLKDIAWTTVATTEHAGCNQPACSCPHRPAPSPPVPAPSPPRPAGHMKIDTVHFVSSFHLDLGFAIPNGFSAGIFDITWNEDVYHKRPEGYLFQAMNTSRALRARGGEERMKFLPPPYLLSLGLDCPPNMTMGTADPLDTVHCPSEAQKTELLRGVADGDIGLWGVPFNMQVEWMMDPSLVEFSVQLVHDMADKYNFTNRGTTFATHDVPGITRAAIPVFKKMGIKAINIGVDRASAVPATGPVCYNSSGGFAYTNDCVDFQSTGRPAFVWRDVPSGEEMITMVNPYGYANMEDSWLEHWLNSTVTVPCSSHALALNWRHDNDGPAGLEEVLDIYAHLRKEFPGAKIIASTLDAFADEMIKAKSCLPVVESEMGDTWSHGPPSDPLKVSMFRALTRKRRQCVDEGRCNNSDHRFYNFSRLLLKNAEHDWGRSGGAMSSDQSTGWSNAEFHAKLAVETTPASGWNSTNDCELKTNSGPACSRRLGRLLRQRPKGLYNRCNQSSQRPSRVTDHHLTKTNVRPCSRRQFAVGSVLVNKPPDFGREVPEKHALYEGADAIRLSSSHSTALPLRHSAFPPQ